MNRAHFILFRVKSFLIDLEVLKSDDKGEAIIKRREIWKKNMESVKIVEKLL